jgi:hypothetical protein
MLGIPIIWMPIIWMPIIWRLIIGTSIIRIRMSGIYELASIYVLTKNTAINE